MTDEEFNQCKICWEAFVSLSTNEDHRNTVKKAEMMVKEIGAIGTFAMCGFEKLDIPEEAKQVIADGLMYLELSNQRSAGSN
ncbi:MAG: hypothetical protein ABFC84_11970 [Veillonellales bacterium]